MKSDPALIETARRETTEYLKKFEVAFRRAANEFQERNAAFLRFAANGHGDELSSQSWDDLYQRAEESGRKDAAVALLREAANCIDVGTPMPISVRNFAVKALVAEAERLEKKRGGSARNSARDRAICTALKRLKERGISPTRNRENKRAESGCKIVKDSLAAIGVLHLDEPALEKIWGRRDKILRRK